MHKVNVRADVPEMNLIITFQTRKPFWEVRPCTYQNVADRSEKKFQMKFITHREVRQIKDKYYGKVYKDTTNPYLNIFWELSILSKC